MNLPSAHWNGIDTLRIGYCQTKPQAIFDVVGRYRSIGLYVATYWQYNAGLGTEFYDRT